MDREEIEVHREVKMPHSSRQDWTFLEYNDLSYGQRIEFTCEDNAGNQERARPNFAAGVPNQSTAFT